MKTFFTILIIALCFCGCKKETPKPGTGSYQANTINYITCISNPCGDKNVSDTFEIDKVFGIDHSIGWYNIDSNYTSIGLQSAIYLNSLNISFPGKSIGKFVIIRRPFKDYSIRSYIDYLGYYSHFKCDKPNYPDISSGDSIILNITKYDNIGGIIEGNFNGAFIDYVDSIGPPKPYYTFVKGNFSVTRGDDWK